MTNDGKQSLNKYKSGALFSIKLILFIEKYLYMYYHKNDDSASIFGMMREERSLKFKFESWPPIIGGIMKVKRANRLISIIDEIWVIHLQKLILYYPLTNEVVKGNSNATVHPSFLPSFRLSVCPSFRNILVNTLESRSFNGFWPKSGTLLIFKVIGQRFMSPGQIFTA